MEHSFSFEGGRVRVVERGPPAAEASGNLIFLHGRYGSADSWSGLVGSLCRKFRCLMVELPGFGRSHPAGLSFTQHEVFLRDLVGHFAPPRGAAGNDVVLVGHDVGGTLAQLAMRGLADRLAGLVLINSGCLAEAERRPCAGFFRAWKARRCLERLVRQASSLSRESRSQFASEWGRCELRSSRLRALQRLSSTWPPIAEREGWRQTYGGLDLPVLLLWGKRDSLNPPATGFALMRSLKQAEFFELDDAGHWPYLEAPDWVTHKMREFLFKVEGRAASREAG